MDRAALSKLVVGESNAERLKQLEVEKPSVVNHPVFHHVWEATCWWILKHKNCPGDDDVSCKND